MDLDKIGLVAAEYEAKDLVHKFMSLTKSELPIAKKCAEIVCDKIIEQYIRQEGYTVVFYKEVKTQITKIKQK